MPSGLIFITGATGFIGSTTAKAALQAGYSLRISIRKNSQIEKLTTILGSNLKSKYEFVVISDITDPEAFAGKLDGVDYVLHMASPLPGAGVDKNAYFGPSVRGTTAILKEAKKVGSVRKVVITSSIAARIPMTGPGAGKVTDINDPTLTIDENADFAGKDDGETAFQLYHASKILSNQASWKFMADEKPHFTLITIHPAFVYGHNPTQTSAAEVANGTNGLLWSAIMMEGKAGNLSYVYVGDVAEAHIRALDESVKESTDYLVSGPPREWNDVLEVVEKEYPNLPVRLGRDVKAVNLVGDTGKAERELGIKWKSLEDVVREVVDQQLGFM